MSDALTEPFAEHRGPLFSLAYRMLGSGSEAEDVLQDAWLRWRNVVEKGEEIRNRGAWLSTCVTRLCLDRLRASKRRREEYFGPWLPEPEVFEEPADPQAISLAFVLLLEALSPQERAVYLLREAFDYQHEEIASALGVSAQVSRKALSRAREHVRKGRPRFAPSPGRHAELLMRFTHACQTGDVASVEAMLSEDARAMTDGGGKVSAATRVIRGRSAVARFFVGLAAKAARGSGFSVRPIQANGWPALVVVGPNGPSVVTIETDGEVVNSVFVASNPDKLSRVER
ncbi:ECF RNA polymerase sigma factor SigJ [Enhygromyxa salina]|uniref:ECF RNA polymerase sigma factor SigJ n=1 Tax=Enhygromyxa salina TaxID=215803 RepID=A0A2S9YJL9_9BACT|nr:RNA polymerase sigma factor SigJ [Enhygromyxa salina]PRQ05307.1 ECF RNA polymerase sigma factor SigJ [Enhygromyxa salina]